MEVFLQIITLIAMGTFALFFKSYLSKYFGEKAKNLATKEDIEEITEKVEKVKQEQNLIYSEIKNNRERFNNKQFELYNELWSSLVELKISADSLWGEENSRNLKDFIEKLVNAEKSVMKSSLLLEDEHYNELMRLINIFKNFMIGKKTLIEQRRSRNIDESEIIHTIENNREYKIKYDELIEKLKSKFKAQIKQGFE